MFSQACKINRGRGLGGSSNINGLIYTRGSPFDYDVWAKLTKDELWAYKNVLKYFKKSEDYHGNYKLSAFIYCNALPEVNTSEKYTLNTSSTDLLYDL